MSKIISPLLIRFKNIPNYLNTIHLKLTKNVQVLTYDKFFKLILTFLWLFKKQIIKSTFFSKKIIYFYCSYYDCYNLNLSLVFYKLEGLKLLYLQKRLILLSNYLNYFIKSTVDTINYFVFILIKKFMYNNQSIHHILTSITNFIKYTKNFKKKIQYFIKSLLRSNKIYKNSQIINGVKCIYSGCLYKNSKKKSIKYMVGNTSTTPILSNVVYSKKTLKTNIGIVGIKLWLYK